jgi:L-rhamnose mutarotase
MAKEETDAKRQALMVPYFETLGELHPGKGMFKLEEVFHLD